MPGSPPISVTLPMTIPPPRTRSSSLIAGHDAAFFLGGADAFQLLRHKACLPRYTRRSGGLAGGRFGRLGYDILGHGIPRAAGRAAPQPAGAGLAALGADVDGFEFLFGHGFLLKVDTSFIIAQNTPGGKYAQYKNICSRKSAILITDLTAEECGTPHGNNERIRVETVGRAVRFLRPFDAPVLRKIGIKKVQPFCKACTFLWVAIRRGGVLDARRTNWNLFGRFYYPFIKKFHLFIRMKPMLSIFHNRKC